MRGKKVGVISKMELYNIFNDLISKLSNEDCIKLGESLIEYGKNDKQMGGEK